MEISSRTTRSRESWSVIVKVLSSPHASYSGSYFSRVESRFTWAHQSVGEENHPEQSYRSVMHFSACVSFGQNARVLTIGQLPVRRQSHPPPSKTVDLIRQELEAYGLMFPDISFSLRDASKTKESHLLKIPKVAVNLFPVPHIHTTLLPRSRLAPRLRRFDIFMAVHSQRKVYFCSRRRA